MAKVAFIGLGTMGYPMAGHIQNNGHDVCVFNRTKEKAKKWEKQYGGKAFLTIGDAVKDADFVFSCVGKDEDVTEVTCGYDGAFKKMKKGSIFIDNTTASAKLAVELSKTAMNQGIGFLDAPVSGGQAGAENGVLTVMVGGEQKVFDSAKAIIDSYAQKVELMGGSGCGQLTKMVNQICIAGLVQGLSEGLDFARAADLDPKQVAQVISKGAAQSWQMVNRYETMIEGKFNYGFAVDWMRKDLKIAMEEANRNGALLPVTELVDTYYADVQKMGGNRWDTSSLIERLKRLRIDKE